MKVILRSDVEKVGRAGEVRQVTPGFARNFLIPRGLALEATPSAIKWFEKGAERRLKLREKQTGAAQEIATKISGVTLSFTRPVGEQGKLFGSVGKSDIVESLKASGFTVDKKAVILTAAIKEAGEFQVELKLQTDVTAKVKVNVLPRS